MIKIHSLNFSIDNKKIITNISAEVKKGQFVGIIGANGSGKSTLLKNVYRFLKYDSGEVLIDNMSLLSYSPKDLSKQIAVLAQKQNINFDFTVEEIVEMGKYASISSIFEEKKNKEKSKLLREALEHVGMSEMSDRSFLSLSGGEMQRVLIARALVQNTKILVLDEPTNHLDIKYQIQIMDLVKKIDKTILAVIHDINIASSYCDYIYALKNGKLILEGQPKEVFTKENISNIYDIDCEILEHPKTKRPLIVF